MQKMVAIEFKIALPRTLVLPNFNAHQLGWLEIDSLGELPAPTLCS